MTTTLSNQDQTVTPKSPNSLPLKESKRPFLWVDDIIAAHTLQNEYRIGLPGDESEGHHIIAMQSEVAIRLIAGKIQAAGGTVQIFPCLTPLDVSISTMGTDAAIMIMMGAIPYDQWLASIKGEPLQLEEAVAIAKNIISSEVDSEQRNITLDILRRRAKVSEYNWDKKFLDPIRARLERALGLPSEVSRKEQRELDLLALSKETDFGKFIDARITFCKRYGWSKQEVDQALLHLNSVNKPKAKRTKGKDFLLAETNTMSWLYSGIIPIGGVTILGGEAGVGKTTGAYDIVGSFLRGEEFLGEKPVKTGKVLIVTGDERACFIQDKLIDREVPLNDDWEVLENWDVSQGEVLRETIEELRPDLVLFDSFSSIHRDPSFDENSSQAKNTIYELELLAETYNFGCIVIHHLSKSKDSKGVGKLRGSSAIPAAASVVILMEKVNETRRKLSFPKIRGARTEPYIVELDASTGRFKVIQGGDDNVTKSIGDRIFALLSKDPYKALELEEISAELGIPMSQKDSVYQALGRLFNKAMITKRLSNQGGKRKVYGVAKPSQLSQELSQPEGLGDAMDVIEDTPPLPLLNLSVKSSESIDIQAIDVTDKITDSIPDTQLTLEDDLHVVSTPNNGISSIEAKLTDTDTQGGVSLPSDNFTELNEVESSTLASQEIDWVTYKGKTWRVSKQVGNTLHLRQSGFGKVEHKVHLSQVVIGEYRQ